MKKAAILIILAIVFALASCTQVGNSDTSANTSADPATDATTGSTADTTKAPDETTAPEPIEVTPNRTGEITVGGETLVLPEFDPFVISKANPRPANSYGATDSVPEEDYASFNVALVRLDDQGGETLDAYVLMMFVESEEALARGGLVGQKITIDYRHTRGEKLFRMLASDHHYALMSFSVISGYGYGILPIEDGKLRTDFFNDYLLWDANYVFAHHPSYFPGKRPPNGMDVSELPEYYETSAAQALAAECYHNSDVPVLRVERLSAVLGE